MRNRNGWFCHFSLRCAKFFLLFANIHIHTDSSEWTIYYRLETLLLARYTKIQTGPFISQCDDGLFIVLEERRATEKIGPFLHFVAQVVMASVMCSLRACVRTLTASVSLAFFFARCLYFFLFTGAYDSVNKDKQQFCQRFIFLCSAWFKRISAKKERFFPSFLVYHKIREKPLRLLWI